MFNRILVGLDGSENSWIASDYGIYLSKVLKRPVVAIHIVDIRLVEGAFLEDIIGALGFSEFDNLSEKVKESLDEKGKVILEIFAKKCREKGADCSIAQVFGIAGKEIVNMADPEDLLIIGRHGKHKNLLQMVMGTTADYIVDNAKCPVMLVSEVFRPIRNIAVFSDDEKILDFAVELAKQLGLKEISKITSEKDVETQIKNGIFVKFTFVPIDCNDNIETYLKYLDIDVIVTEKENAKINTIKPLIAV